MSMETNKPFFFPLFLFLFILSLETQISKGLDFISSGQSLSRNQTVSSQDGTFELGFFTPGNSQNYYIGIWYKRLPNKTVVWVANRNQPISESHDSELKLLENGNLVLLNQSKHGIWSTNSTSNVANSTRAMLLDNGNFVIRENLSVLWQSFDYPTDTWLPGGKIGYNKLRNEKQILNSWRSSENPSTSLFSVEVESNGTSHILVWNWSKLYWTSGEWNGKVFEFVPEIALDLYITNLTYISNENERYFTYEAAFPNALTRFVLDVTGQLKQFVWGNNFPGWTLFWTRPSPPCEVYGFCGAFSRCNQVRAPLCNCMEGFEPKVAKDWELQDHTYGCVRRNPLQCNEGGNDTFSRIPNARFPVDSEPLTASNITECERVCHSNCSCTAYAYDNGCFVWKGELFNLQELSTDDNTGKVFHVRVAAMELIGTTTNRTAKTKSKFTWIIIGSIGGFSTLFSILLLIIWRRRDKNRAFKTGEDSLMVFKYKDIRNATKNFSQKLGEGGFGSVFKGTLQNSTAIAVKSLKIPQQGDKQFRAEVSTIGLIQHINLVRLRGFCIQGTKRFLVYDYMINGSLESHLFRKNSNTSLDWKTRFNIAVGTARGLAYLHEKCRDCIVHCDIKPENILLDAEFNPKVGDFGLAKLIGREFSRVLTTVRGTRGYLAPEWISGEAITPKADVFSYGMLLFEIISGRRNRDLLDDGTNDYFPALVANRLNEGGEVMGLLDKGLEGNADEGEVIRACKVACWCIQNDEKDRPSMGVVVQTLEGVSEVGIPPFPRFLLGFAENQGEAIDYEQISSSSTLHLHE